MKNNKDILAIIILLIIIVITSSFTFYYSKPVEVETKPATIIDSNSIDNSFDTESVPPGGAPYVNVDNINEKTNSTVIVSPVLGQKFALGQTLPIVWNPELIDVSTILLVSEDGKEGGMQIYRRIKLNDQTSIDARFNYTIPNNLTVYPGRYRVKLQSYNAKDVYVSDAFTIESLVPLPKRVSEMYSIKSIIGAKDMYSIGNTISLNIETSEFDNTTADASEGFNVQARLYDNNNVGVWSGNAKYDVGAKIWHLDIPVIENTYRINVTLYCSYITLESVCMQRYGDNNQVEKFLNFQIKK